MRGKPTEPVSRDFNFGLLILRYLSEEDQSQVWLAKKVGITEASMSYYISGLRTPDARTFLKICEVTGIDPKEVRF